MKQALLTIDDGPTVYTKKIVDFLKAKSIKPVMFFSGSKIEAFEEEALYAVTEGIIVGNHG